MSRDDIATRNDSEAMGEELKTIYDSGIALISSKKQINEVLRVIAESALGACKADVVILHQYDQKKDEFMGFPVTAGHIYQPEFLKRKPDQNHIAYEVVRAKTNYYAEDAVNNPVMSRQDYPLTAGTTAHFIFREKVLSAAAILLLQDKEIVGVMFIYYRQPVSFSKGKKYLMDIFASHAAIAIKNAREKEELTKKLTLGLARIYNIREQIEGSYSVDQEAIILQRVLDDTLDFLDESRCSFAEYDARNKRLTVKLASKLYQDLIGASWNVEQGLTGYTVRTQQLQYVPDCNQNEHFFRFADGKIEGFHTDADKEVKSTFTVPLILGGGVLGVFQFESKNLDGFSEYDREIIKTMTVQAVNAIQNVRLIREKELARKKISALHKLDILIGSTWKLEAVFKYVMETAIDLIKSPESKGRMSLIEKIDGKRYLIPDPNSGYPYMKKNIALDQEKGITRLAVSENRTINATEADELWEKYYIPMIPGMRSELAVPLKVRDQSIGIINIESPFPNAFDKEDEELLETLAGQAVIVIMVTRLIEDIKSIGLAGSTKSKREFLDLILSKACELLGASIGAIWLFDRAAKSFQFGTYLGVEINLWENLQLDLDNSFVGPVLKARKIKAAHINELMMSSAVYQKNFIGFHKAGLRSIISTPFIAGEEDIGVMNIYSRDEIDIKNWESSWEKSLLELFAALASVALQNFQRFAEIEEAKTKIEQSVNKTIFDNLRQMLRLVTHRMNNSVGNIRADINDLLEAKDKFDKKTVKKLEDIKEAALEALGVPSELDNLAKRLKSDKAEVHLYNIIHDLLRDKDTKEITISYESVKKAHAVKANPDLLKEVFGELIQNATKAMPKGGEIAISAKIVKPQMLEVSVRDSGHGIAKENLEKVFEYGYTQWKTAKGTGDGLALIKTVIEVDHKGKISFESEEGKGCTVKLLLPLFDKASI